MNLTDCPIDPIDFVSKEKWITVTTIGSIFTYAMVNRFRETIFDPILVYILPPESFEFMQIELPDVGARPNAPNPIGGGENKNSYIINFGSFVRESLIWIIMVLILYILALYVRFPSTKGGSPGVAIM
jgi:large-conductance mechanosensitive channel